MLDSIDDFPWASLAQPPDNGPGAVADALRTLAASASEDAAMNACSRFLYALGNNHAGSFYPVALAIFPFILEILADGGEWARVAGLEAVTDLVVSFEPEIGFETVPGADGPIDAKRRLRAEAATLVPWLRANASSVTASLRERQLAAALLAELAGT